MIQLRNVRLPLAAGLDDRRDALQREAAAQALAAYGIAEAEIGDVILYKRSVDARRKSDVHFIATLLVSLMEPASEAELLECAAAREDRDIALHLGHADPLEGLIPEKTGEEFEERERPVVVGAGPAGLFAALLLARAGAAPILVERGEPVELRARRVEDFCSGGALDPECNVQFGEGGAGCFSDGKLTTNIADPLCAYVSRAFVDAGAPSEILWQAKPHIGSDRLPQVLRNLRQEIIARGGDVRFSTRLVGLRLEPAGDGAQGRPLRLAGLRVRDASGCEEELPCRRCILATGHSARDVFELLKDAGLELLPKSFSIGVRVEHLQSAVNEAQYGPAAQHPALGAADYKLSCHLANGRGVYSFCMCPGGEVMASSSEEGAVVTNGMSCFARAAANANSAFLVSVDPADFGSDDPLAGVELQRRLEHAAFELGGGDYKAPAQRMGDFMAKRSSAGSDKKNGRILPQPSYPRGVRWCALDDCLPDFVCASLRAAVPQFERKLRGFADPSAVLTAVESRSSSPVRISRGADYQATRAIGLYPCGEGAGYAGGIMSAAVDGLKIALSILREEGLIP